MDIRQAWCIAVAAAFALLPAAAMATSQVAQANEASYQQGLRLEHRGDV